MQKRNIDTKSVKSDKVHWVLEAQEHLVYNLILVISTFIQPATVYVHEVAILATKIDGPIAVLVTAGDQQC